MHEPLAAYDSASSARRARLVRVVRLKSLFEKSLVVQMPPLYIKPKLEQAEAEAREDMEADAKDETRRSGKEVVEKETQRKQTE